MMAYRSMLIALLGLSLTGCAVYGDGYGYGYGHHYYSTDYYHVDRYPVYVAPRVYYHGGYRYDGPRYYDGKRYYDGRHDQRRYLPAPRAHDYKPERRHQQRFDRGRQEQHLVVPPRQGWDGRHKQLRQQAPQPRRHFQDGRSDDRRHDGRSAQHRPDHRAGQAQQQQAWQGRNDRAQQRAQQHQRHSQGTHNNDRRNWEPRAN